MELLPDLAPGCGGEVRKRLAERVGRHPARPAAVAAVCLPRTVPARAGGPLGGGCIAGVRLAQRCYGPYEEKSSKERA